MSKRNGKPRKGNKSKSVHDDYEIPAELNADKLKFIGIGFDSLDSLDDKVNVSSVKYVDSGKYLKQKAADHRYIQLDEDVHAAFLTAREVNEALRQLLKFRDALERVVAPLKVKRKKTA